MTAAAVVALREILAAVDRVEAVNGLRIVGVDGPSGAGKSTLARRLADLAGASLVEIDDFISWDDFATHWWPRFETQVLVPLIGGAHATYQVRDWAGDEFGHALNGWKTATRTPIVILEGVTCTRASTIGLLAYTIWVEAPRDERLRRGLARDGGSHRALWERWQDEEDAFFAVDRARERADLIVDAASDVPHDPATQVVVTRGAPHQTTWTSSPTASES